MNKHYAQATQRDPVTREFGGVWVAFSPDGNACKSDVEDGTATLVELSRKVLLGCGDGWERASVALTAEEARGLAAELNRLAAEKEWRGIRCEYCGTNLVRGKCPVNKKDCGR